GAINSTWLRCLDSSAEIKGASSGSAWARGSSKNHLFAFMPKSPLDLIGYANVVVGRIPQIFLGQRVQIAWKQVINQRLLVPVRRSGLPIGAKRHYLAGVFEAQVFFGKGEFLIGQRIEKSILATWSRYYPSQTSYLQSLIDLIEIADVPFANQGITRHSQGNGDMP
ncbi:hypothetical protein, partial [Mesorhizobium sp.]|uniref:hypothetical protein n=1 Tax=Mesorhizobium sp. TaxID=1871066 RepID=UPI0025E907C2